MVLDASVVVDLVLARLSAAAVERIFDDSPRLHAPYLLDLEVMQALRRMVSTGSATAAEARAAWAQIELLGVRWHEHEDLRSRIWHLRHVLTSYDAAYLALAEALGTTLFTRDRGLARCRLARTTIELV